LPESRVVSEPLLQSGLLLAQNVPPKAGTPGVAQDSTPAPAGAPSPGGPSGGLMMPLMMILLFVPFFLLMSRRQKKESQARSQLKRGDRIMANSGLIGELVEMDDKVAKVKIAPGVTVQILANTVSPMVDTTKATAKELKEAKAVSDKK
jgi:preprotein translocase subunit YajC